jgi:hypothetical protein
MGPRPPIMLGVLGAIWGAAVLALAAAGIGLGTGGIRRVASPA